ncbi:hypothetical protein F511_41067 [Dorcoceras hygrometricum]|uniref:Uncharacterized protein n=1 Tax=Dorcoceras hygrometricum TaxID=472368 RepID=A0A2Z7CED4_9LAMI|nr:hypothetical protein F511_41067 [Dorcoceras hygrometricum]
MYFCSSAAPPGGVILIPNSGIRAMVFGSDQYEIAIIVSNIEFQIDKDQNIVARRLPCVAARGGATTSAIARAGRAIVAREAARWPQKLRRCRCDGSMLADRCCDMVGRSVCEACRPTHVAGCAICTDARAGRPLASREAAECCAAAGRRCMPLGRR